ncbi:hypothetical protein WJX72_004223 [[Myrmecia] bisecta]|uniref:RAP domain-containing protein n=1 Tax=[Myrmecia] bisecta TaxID=41462 RepID=A0AAW1PK48_9CHLO
MQWFGTFDRVPDHPSAQPSGPPVRPQQKTHQRQQAPASVREVPATAKGLTGRDLTWFNNKRLIACRSAAEILHFVEGHLDGFNVVNAVTAFHRLAKHCQHVSEADKEAIRADPRTQAVAARVASFEEDWRGMALPNIAWAQGSLQHGPPDLIPKVAERVRPRLRWMNEQEVANVVWALARVGHDPPGWFDNAATVIRDQMPTYGPRATSQLMWAFATIDKYDEDLFETCAMSSLHKLRPYAPQGLANLAWAFAKMEHYNEEFFDALAAEVVLREHQLNMRDIASLAWAYGKIYSVVMKRANLPEEDMMAQSLFLHELTTVPVRRRLFRCLSHRAQALRGALPAQAISNILWGYATVQIRDQILFDTMAKECVLARATFDPQSLCLTLWSLAAMRHEDPQLFDMLAEVGLRLARGPATRGDFTEQGMTMCIFAYATLDAVHTPACQAFLAEMARMAEQAVSDYQTPQSLANLAWGLAVAGRLTPDLFRAIRARSAQVACQAGSTPRDFGSMELKQLYQAELALRLEGPGVPVGLGLHNKQLSADVFESLFESGRLKQTAQETWNRHKAIGPRAVTEFHLSVADALSALGATFIIEYDQAEYSVDIAFPEQGIIVEVDGPTHYSYNTLRPTGATLFKRRLLAKLGWKVVSVPSFHWAHLGTAFQQQLYMYHAMAAIGMQLQKPAPPANLLPDDPDADPEALSAWILRLLSEQGASPSADFLADSHVQPDAASAAPPKLPVPALNAPNEAASPSRQAPAKTIPGGMVPQPPAIPSPPPTLRKPGKAIASVAIPPASRPDGVIARRAGVGKVMSNPYGRLGHSGGRDQYKRGKLSRQQLLVKAALVKAEAANS